MDCGEVCSIRLYQRATLLYISVCFDCMCFLKKCDMSLELFVEEVRGYLWASLAALSAFSFPVIPMWLGIQINIILGKWLETKFPMFEG